MCCIIFSGQRYYIFLKRTRKNRRNLFFLRFSQSTVNCQLSYTSSASNRSSECEIRTANCQLPSLLCARGVVRAQKLLIIPFLFLKDNLNNLCRAPQKASFFGDPAAPTLRSRGELVKTTDNCQLLTVNCQLSITNRLSPLA